jgi:hypothetical protein
MTPARKSPTRKRRTSETLPRLLDRRLLLYTLAAGATLSATPAAEAAVVFTPSSAFFQGVGKVDIDLDNDGSSDFTLQIKSVPYDTSNSVQALFVYGNRGPNRVGAGAFSQALALKRNIRIGPGEHFVDRGLMESSNPYGLNGYWLNVKNRCLGVRFVINGEVHYGWIGFRDVGVGHVSARLYGWAYETTPDMQILAGDTGTGAPLDSSISPTSLEILAAGHTVIEERRNRTALAVSGNIGPTMPNP